MHALWLCSRETQSFTRDSGRHYLRNGAKNTFLKYRGFLPNTNFIAVIFKTFHKYFPYANFGLFISLLLFLTQKKRNLLQETAVGIIFTQWGQKNPFWSTRILILFVCWKYHKIESTEDCTKHCFKNEWTLRYLITKKIATGSKLST